MRDVAEAANLCGRYDDRDDPYRMGALPIRAIRGGAGEPPESGIGALTLRGA